MLTSTQKQTAQSIINLFETGVVLGDYGNVTVITGDTGHLTFGRSQTTPGSRNLLDLLKRKPAGERPRCAPGATRPLGPQRRHQVRRHLRPDLYEATQGIPDNARPARHRRG